MGFSLLKFLEVFCSAICLSNSLFLKIRQKTISWPIDILTSILYFTIHCNKSLYGQCMRDTMCIMFSFYGWFLWSYKKKDHNKLKKITKTNPFSFLSIVLFGIILTIIIHRILKHLNGNFAFLDASKTGLGIVGAWMLSNKKMEAYWIWIISDILSAYLYFLNELYWFSFKYIVSIFLSLYGSLVWYKIYTNQMSKQNIKTKPL